MPDIWRLSADRQLSRRASKQQNSSDLETAVQIGCFVLRGQYLALAAGGKPDVVSQRVPRENSNGHQSASRKGREV